MIVGLTVEVIYSDEDLVELRITAGNGQFSGTADLYENSEAATKLAEALRRFPLSESDVRSHELGNFNPQNGGGGARLAISQSDNLGHCIVEVTIRADARSSEAAATFPLHVEPAGIDSFVSELCALGRRIGAKAHLPGSAAA